MFFVVKTISNSNTPMGHWIVFYIKNFNLLFIDFSGMNRKFYGWDIDDFYCLCPGCKNIMQNEPTQSEFSYVCGAYCVVLSY